MIVEESVKRRRFKRPAIFADTTNYGQLGVRDLKKKLRDLDIFPVVVETFSIGDKDMAAQVARAKEAGADVISTYGIDSELAQIANAMGKLGWKVPMIGSWTLSTTSFIDGAGTNGNGAMMPQTFFEIPDTVRRKAFIDAYRASFRVDRIASPVAAVQGYDSVYLLAAAVSQAGSTTTRPSLPTSQFSALSKMVASSQLTLPTLPATRRSV
jgi:branched-chain amino acid transport system substrate-binding protein